MTNEQRKVMLSMARAEEKVLREFGYERDPVRRLWRTPDGSGYVLRQSAIAEVKAWLDRFEADIYLR